ncbi:MAG: helix-turn-helix domain-containing protein, partial [Actinomyces sp.]
METRGEGVSVVRLPEERERLAELRRRGVPRLVLVAASELAAAVAGTDATGLLLEDWAPPEASSEEIAVRRRALAARCRCVARPVTVSDEGILTAPGGRVVLGPVEARILGVLLERAGSVVSRAELARAGWPGRHVPRNSLDVHVSRLRRRLGG